MNPFKRFEKTPTVDTLRFDEQQLSSLNEQLSRLTERVQPDTSPRRVGLFNLLRFEGQFYDRTRNSYGSDRDDKRVRVWLGTATNPITNRTQPYNVAVIEDDWDGSDIKYMVDLDTGSYGYDIDGFHLSQVDRLRESEYGSELSGMVSEGTIYNAFFYGLSDAGSPNMYRDTASPSQ